MILNPADGTEAVFLTRIFKTTSEDKSLSEVLKNFAKPERVPELLQKIRAFALLKLDHPVMKLALRRWKYF